MVGIYFVFNFWKFLSNFDTLVLGFLTNNLFVGYYSIAEKIVRILQSLQVLLEILYFHIFLKYLKIRAIFLNLIENIRDICMLYTLLVQFYYLSYPHISYIY